MGGYSVLVAALMATTVGCSAAMAQERQFSFDIAAKPVPQAVNDIGRIAGLSVVFAEDRPITAISQPVRGAMTADQALEMMLSGTGLGYRFSNTTTVQIFDRTPVAQGDGILLSPIIVQGKLAYSGAIKGYLAPATETSVKAGAPLAEVPQ